jgi:predicted O-linked N-acetylglucosamine transferase (SPINDLY family)
MLRQTHVSPAKLQSLLQNGLVQHRAGRLAEAEKCYRQARAIAPRSFDALHLSGLLAHQQGQTQEAIDLLSRALTLSPAAVVCELRLAIALSAAKRLEDAEKHLRHVVAAKSDYHEAWDQLATCLRGQDRLNEAVACHERVVALKPGHALGWVNFGFTRRARGQLEEALACHEQAIAIDPSCAKARFGRAQALQQLHRVREAVADYDAFLRLEPHAHEARSNRLFALQNIEDVPRERLFAEHVAYGRALGSAPVPRFENAPDTEKRLRVGVLSPDLREHSCAYFLEPLLRFLNRDEFELFLYHDHFRSDKVTTRFKALADTWRHVSGMSAAALEQQLREDRLDVLIDLAGHTGVTNRLPVLARKVAPVQVTYLGYPNTTGVPAIDYRLTDAIADPVGDADAFATEKLVRFAPTAWAYQPPAGAPEVAAPPCLKNGYVTFGCFNDLAKLTDSMFVTWRRVLETVPGSRLRLKGRGLSLEKTRTDLLGRLRAAGIEATRVDLLERTPDTMCHLAVYHDVDIALDTAPYNGTTTTCEALWMGVPVVSLVGDRHVARVGASLLHAIGRGEWCAVTRDDYVNAAVGLATDLARLAEIRGGLRGELRRSALLDHAAQAERFGATLREGWRAWCASVRPVELVEAVA